MLWTNILFAQDLQLPEESYVMVIGTDTLISETLIKETGLYNQEPFCLRTYVFKDELYRVNYDQRIDTIMSTDFLTGKDSIIIDINDHYDSNHLMGVLHKKQLKKLINTEIEVYQGNRKLEIYRIASFYITPDGDVFGENDNVNTMFGIKKIKHAFKKMENGTHIGLSGVWFYNKKDEMEFIDGNIVWKILK